jgi:hypothetical protein
MMGGVGYLSVSSESFLSSLCFLGILTTNFRNYQGAYFYEHGKEHDTALWYNNPEEMLSMPSVV